MSEPGFFLAPSRLRGLLSAHGVTPHRRRGQHFLIDRHALERIMEIARLDESDRVMEVGAGAGTLTAALASRAGRVVAVEIDRGLVPVLEEVLGEAGVRTRVEILVGDALKMDWSRVLEGAGWAFVSNLPYGITSPVLERVMTGGLFTRAVIMIQRDVADRLTAAPGGRDYSSLSLFARYHAVVRVEFNLGPGSFYPRPRVDSSVVSIDLSRGPAVESVDPELLLDLIRTSFLYRRKQMVNSLAESAVLGTRGGDRDLVRRVLSSLGWERARGEILSLEDFERLTRALVQEIDR